MPDLTEFEIYLDTAAWIRDLPEASSEGFQDTFLNAYKHYCSRTDNQIGMAWDSLGHLQVTDFDLGSLGDSDLVPSSSVPTGCYEIRIFGRFLDGVCSSSSSSSSCESDGYFCGLTASTGLDIDLEEAKELRLCHDELGHLVSIRICDDLRWHQDFWEEDISPSDNPPSGSDVDPIWDVTSPSSEGVVLLAYLPLLPSSPSSSSSSSCDLEEIMSRCAPLEVRRVLLWYDSVGLLAFVSKLENAELPCGILTPCDATPMPKRFLAVFNMSNIDLEPIIIAPPYQQCVIMEHDGCEWKGVVNVPCCIEIPASPGHDPSFILTYREIEVRISCVPPPPGPIAGPPWYLCFDGVRAQFLHFTTCPLDGDTSLRYDIGDCDTVFVSVEVMEIPCRIACASNEFLCAAPSHVSGPVSNPPPPP